MSQVSLSTQPENPSSIELLESLDSNQLKYWLERLLNDTPVNPIPPVKGEIVDILRYIHSKLKENRTFQREFRRQIFDYFIRLVVSLPDKSIPNLAQLEHYNFQVEKIDNLINLFNIVSEFRSYQNQIAKILTSPEKPLLGHKYGPFRDLHLALLSIYIDYTDGALDESIKLTIDDNPSEQLFKDYLKELIPQFRSGPYYELALRYFTWHLGLDFKPYFNFVDRCISYMSPNISKNFNIDELLLFDAIKYLLRSRGSIVWPYLFDWLYEHRPKQKDVVNDKIINKRIIVQHLVKQLAKEWNTIASLNYSQTKEDEVYHTLNTLIIHLHLPTDIITYDIIYNTLNDLSIKEEAFNSFKYNKPLKSRYTKGVTTLRQSEKFDELVEFGILEDNLIVSPKVSYEQPEDEFSLNAFNYFEVSLEIDFNSAPLLINSLYRVDRFDPQLVY